MRELEGHRVNPANDKLVVTVCDEPGAGGACHHYRIEGFDSGSNPSDPFAELYGNAAQHSTILFQNGPIAEVGVNGVTHEALLAILIDRLAAFQAGPYVCEENRQALVMLKQALWWLKERTQARMARGVEGTHER